MTMTTTAAGGLRERRKQQTRATLSDVATQAFLERGFDQVTIAEVARLAGVSKMTVTNYFPLKEDLVFDRADDIAGGPVEAVLARPSGETVPACLRRHYLDALDRGDPTLGHRGADFTRMVTGSPALLAKAREIVDRRERALVAALQDEPGADPVDAAMAARILTAAMETLQDAARDRLFDGVPEAQIVAELRRLADRLFGVAESAVAALLP